MGHVAHTIVEYAKAISADLIVMGTHGRTGLAHFIIGSVAERVVRLAPCPVLTVGLEKSKKADAAA
jgi:nucleotide-binding universal stress UspA family protein